MYSIAILAFLGDPTVNETRAGVRNRSTNKKGNRNLLNMENTTLSCRQCGACCRWAGYVRLREGEVDAIAAFLGMGISEFTERYTRLAADRHDLSLIENQDQTCVFLTADSQCQIHDTKPRQCRDFPLLWSFPGVEAVCPACQVPA